MRSALPFVLLTVTALASAGACSNHVFGDDTTADGEPQDGDEASGGEGGDTNVVTCDSSEPGDLCEGDTPRQCEGGLWVKQSPCAGETPSCQPETGSCTCEAAARRCVNTSTAEECNAEGAWVESSCPSETPFCEGAGFCECESGAGTECADRKTLHACVAGKWKDTACVDAALCLEDECVDSVIECDKSLDLVCTGSTVCCTKWYDNDSDVRSCVEPASCVSEYQVKAPFPCDSNDDCPSSKVCCAQDFVGGSASVTLCSDECVPTRNSGPGGTGSGPICGDSFPECPAGSECVTWPMRDNFGVEFYCQPVK